MKMKTFFVPQLSELGFERTHLSELGFELAIAAIHIHVLSLNITVGAHDLQK